MDKSIILNDNVKYGDSKTLSSHSNPYYRTQVIAGYDHYIDEKGINRFGETILDEENMILIGGSIFSLEKIFNTRMDTTHMTVSQLRDVFDSQGIQHPIGWSASSTDPHTANNAVCLFGVGIGGAGDSIADIADVKYYQRNVESMVPLRVVDADHKMSEADHKKYYCRSVDGNGMISYYLKSFDSAVIKCKWRDSANEAEGSDVTSGYFNTSPDVTTPIETFIEITLKISKDDVREYFENNADVERARINTIGLYSAVPVTLETPIPVAAEDGSSTLFERTTEYDQVTCFSCLNFDNEMLALPKELTIIYRIFTK